MLARQPFYATLVALAAALCLAAVATAASKPVGIPTYKQCITKTNCSASASSDPNGKNLQINFSKVKCPLYLSVMNSGIFGPVQPSRSTGKFSLTKDLPAYDQKSATSYMVHLKLTGTAHLKQSITGSYTATTDFKGCSAASQKATAFKLKFGGLVYGG